MTTTGTETRFAETVMTSPGSTSWGVGVAVGCGVGLGSAGGVDDGRICVKALALSRNSNRATHNFINLESTINAELVFREYCATAQR